MDSLFIKDCYHMLSIDEGIRAYPYNDLTGKPHKSYKGKLTIGIGRNIEDVGLTETEILFLLKNDIEHCVRACYSLIDTWGELDDTRRMALVNMCFQMGATGLSKFRQSLALIKVKDWKGASNSLQSSLWAKQTPHRAARVISMIETGENPYAKLPSPDFVTSRPGPVRSL